MKKNNIILFASALLFLGACTDTALDPLSGVFPAPKEVQLSSLSGMTNDKGANRIITVDLSSPDGVKLHAVFVADKNVYFLPSSIYTAADAATAKKGNFISTESTIDGKGIASGNITVEGDGVNYKVKAVLFTEDGSPYKCSWSGTIPFEPEAVVFDLVDRTIPRLDGNLDHYVDLIDEDGKTVAEFYIILAPGQGFTGNYTVEENVSSPGQMGNGWMFDASAWGMGIMSGGSFLVDGDTKLWILAGNKVNIAQEPDGTYSFTSDELLVSSTGSAADGVKTTLDYQGSMIETLTQFGSLTSYVAWGMNMVGVELLSDGITITPGAWGNTYTGSGKYLKLELYSTDGSIAPGEYKACEVGGTINPSEFGIGYDGVFGPSGTTWYTLADSVPSYTYITDGTLKVSESGGIYTITLRSSVINVTYSGPLAAQ